jgi:site-specific DNA-cytosine methylase
MLFWTTLEIIAHVLKHNPSAKFLMENVKMKKDFEQYITHHTEQALGKVEKTLINSALVSAQNRNRYYWTNFEVTQPDDKGILLKDILESNPDVKYTVNQDALPRYTDKNGKVKGFRDAEQKSNCLTASMHKGFGNDGCTVVYGGAIRGRYIVDGKRQDHKMKTAGLTEQRLEVRNDGKTNTLTTVQKDNVVVYSVNDNDRVSGITENERGFRPHKADSAKSGISELGRILKTNSKTDTLTTSHSPKVALNSDVSDLKYRKLTPTECERLQTFPDNWTDCVSNTQRYKSLGNAWTVDVIVHILKCAFN